MSVTCFNIRELIIQGEKNKFEIKLILRYVLDLTAAQLIMADEYVLTPAQQQKFNLLKQRFLACEPLHYILGSREFYSRQFRVTPETLIPRPETELLIENVLKLAKPGMRVLDLGTGSGCIAVTLKLECPNLVVVAVDKYVETLSVAQGNAANLGAEIEFRVSDWYENIEGTFDIIVSNPPYIAMTDTHLINLSYEPQHALTDFNDGLDCLRQIIQKAVYHLVPGGELLVEHGYDQGSAVRNLFHLAGFYAVEILQDYANLDRITKGKLGFFDGETT